MTNLQIDQASKEATYNKGYTNSEEVRLGFIKGALWHESLPLAERLTESEVSALRKLHLKYQQYRDEHKDKGEWGDARSCDEAIVVLEFLFGKDLFTDTSE